MLAIVLQVLRWVLLAAQVWVALPITYLCIVAGSALLARAGGSRASRRAADRDDARHPMYRFAFLVPAHNEEQVLSHTLASLTALAYPKDACTIHLVADNCTDGTAQVARAHTSGQVRVHERFDVNHRGKGYALRWILQQLASEQLTYDAYVVIDADSTITPNFLTVMSRELARGRRVLQARYTVLNATESPGTVLRWIAFTLMTDVRQWGRYALGGSSSLLGNGMVFSHDLLRQHPWQALALSEDYEYYLSLVTQGERVCYVPDAVVSTVMPTTFAQMRTQDIRWESSIPGQPKWLVALRLLGAGMRQHDLVRLDAAAELLTPPLSVIVAMCVGTLVGALLLWSAPQILFGIVLAAALMCFVGSAFYLLRPPWAAYRALLYAPGFVLWKLWVVLVLRHQEKHRSTWVPTRRAASSHWRV